MTGAEVRDWRTARGWSQSTLAARTGISLRFVRKVELGESAVPLSLVLGLEALDLREALGRWRGEVDLTGASLEAASAKLSAAALDYRKRSIEHMEDGA